jgi:CRP-like cAMP-binding protein
MDMETKAGTSDTAACCNHLIALLSTSDRLRLLPHLELVELPAGRVLFESGRPMPFGYFMTTAIVSCLQLLEDGKCVEVAVVGNEGFTGVSLFMGGGPAQGRAVVQRKGHALRISAALLLEEFNRAGALMQVLLVYTQSLLTQVGQIGVCNSYHDADQKLCRWLLLRLDRQADTTVEMTQDLISQMLGVRRMSVTSAVAHLENSGLIQCSRGHITVLDRAAIEARCCECYRVVTREHHRLFRSAR